MEKEPKIWHWKVKIKTQDGNKKAWVSASSVHEAIVKTTQDNPDARILSVVRKKRVA